MEKMMFRLEFNELQQWLRMDNFTHQADVLGWETICDSVEDSIATEFIARVCDKYPRINADPGLKHKGKYAKFSTVERDFDFFMDYSTDMDVIEIWSSYDKTKVIRCPVIHQKRSERGICDPCPYCGKRHTHSIGSGHRLTHCFPKRMVKCFDKAGNVITIESNYYIITLEA